MAIWLKMHLVVNGINLEVCVDDDDGIDRFCSCVAAAAASAVLFYPSLCWRTHTHGVLFMMMGSSRTRSTSLCTYAIAYTNTHTHTKVHRNARVHRGHYVIVVGIGAGCIGRPFQAAMTKAKAMKSITFNTSWILASAMNWRGETCALHINNNNNSTHSRVGMSAFVLLAQQRLYVFKWVGLVMRRKDNIAQCNRIFHYVITRWMKIYFIGTKNKTLRRLATAVVVSPPPVDWHRNALMHRAKQHNAHWHIIFIDILHI